MIICSVMRLVPNLHFLETKGLMNLAGEHLTLIMMQNQFGALTLIILRFVKNYYSTLPINYSAWLESGNKSSGLQFSLCCRDHLSFPFI